MRYHFSAAAGLSNRRPANPRQPARPGDRSSDRAAPFALRLRM